MLAIVGLWLFIGEVIMWARIENNAVMELTDIDPTDRFHPSLIWVECPADIQQGYTYSNGEFTPPQETTAS